LLLIRSNSRHLDEIHPAVRRIELGSRHTGTSLRPLTGYLKTYNPPRMLVAKDRAGRLAVKARKRAGTDTRLVVRLGTNLSEALKNRSGIQRWMRLKPIRKHYPKIDQIVAVSEGVADDTRKISGVGREKISVVRNPVITARLLQLAAETTPHTWLNEKRCPVIIGAGRLTLQKDFVTLIRAFAELTRSREARLIILGEGERRKELLQLVQQLRLNNSVDLPGFTPNPYAFMAAADLFTLSSRWEGSPNVLTEAMALDTPVVSTNCPSGPDEILDGGRIAPLVPVGDHEMLAAAMEMVLHRPPQPGVMRAAVREYEVEHSATRYLQILGLSPIQD
jgi:glycosyltransferase involved in cell wall biosynthesis